ncbi:unnamed protein product [Staurois parvus]|uniref:Uncharacterized protein n=1 Tax=Staurois parvus TaxID=386267 RepID=A0ABN9FLP8_9NEOB|nr:unnamed protein product [Staurois parvus]
MGPCTASSCCCQARNLPWGPCTDSSCCCQDPVICHGPLYRLLMLLPGPECVMGPCTASHCCCLHRPHSAMCHFQVFSHCWWVPFFHRVRMASHCCCLHRHTVAPHSGFGLVTAQMSEVCGDSKIDGTHLHVILTDSIISLPQQTPRAFKLRYSVLH